MQVSDDQAALGLGPLHTAPVAPPLDRTDSSPQAQEALKLEPQTPVKAATRADLGSLVEDPDRAASGSSAGHFSRAPPSGLGPGLTSPGSPSENRMEIQDGRWCSPKHCSCCWATGKAKGTGDLSPHCMLHICCRSEDCHRLQQALSLRPDLMCSTTAIESAPLL